MLEKFLDTLDKIGLEHTAEDVADLLWLADRLPVPKAPKQKSDHPLALGSALPPLQTNESTPRTSLPPNRREPSLILHGEESSETTETKATAHLYPMQAGVRNATGRGGRGSGASLFRSAAAYALPAPLELGRSLRPLNQRVPSRTQTAIDETATAEAIADSIAIFGQSAGLWTPVTEPVPERWLDVALVVDESSSMSIWERTVAEFVTLLERQGAFRDLQCWGMRSDPAASQPEAARVQLYAGIGPNGQRDRLRRPGELLDHRGQRLILVVSDCIAPIWHNGQAAKMLMPWGQRGPLALVQMLPERMWQRTGLRNFSALHLRSREPATANHSLERFGATDWFGDSENGLPLPVITLEAEWMGNWARALAGNSSLWLPGILIHDQPAPTMPTAQERSAEDLVRTFYAAASPLAQQLAIYLSCAPLTLPVMRLVQRVMVPRARQVHLAEVLVSGLIIRPTPGMRYEAADQQNFSFVQGVRELLQNSLRRNEMERVISAISTYVGERSGKQTLDFRALLANPDAEGELTIDESYQAFAEVSAPVLRRFGNQYARVAARLEKTIYGREISKSSLDSAPVTAPTEGEKPKRERPKNQRTDQPTTVRALFIGINQYAESNVRSLNGCLNDIRAVRLAMMELLKEWQLPFEAQVLTDRQATKAAIVSALQEIASQTQEGDQVFIHYSGQDQAIATDDIHEGDGLEETLFVHDSKQDERSTLITHRELLELLTKISERGAQVVLLLDTCRAGSGYLCRQNLDDILIIAASHEAELSYEAKIEELYIGFVSYYLTEALKQYPPGTSWATLFDFVYTHVKAKQPSQTPLMIGARDLCVFSAERKSVDPYLLVTEVSGDEITINAHAALALEVGADLNIYPPGSEIRELRNTRRAIVSSIEDNSALATIERFYQENEESAPISVGSRVEIVTPAAERMLRIGWDTQQTAPTADLILQFVSPDESADYHVRIEREPADITKSGTNQPATHSQWIVEDSDGHVVWQREMEDSSNLLAQTNRVRDLLRAIARYRRIFAQQPRDDNDLADAVKLTVISPENAEEGTVNAGQPFQIRLHNQSEVDLYISLWALDNHLGIQQIYPPSSDCFLLGKGRQIQRALTLKLSGGEQQEEQITFKLFASRMPADLRILQQERVDEAVELGDLEELRSQWREEHGPVPRAARKAPARKARPQPPQSQYEPNGNEWNPGGPVAIRSKLWRNGQTLRVRFLDGDRRVQEKVRRAMLLWTEHANLHFEFGDDPAAEIRISFKEAGSWSYIGKDCLSVARNLPTTNFGWLKPATDEKEVQRVVLREIGFVLGLGKAIFSPIANIPWDRDIVYRYYMGPPNNWTKEMVDQNLFLKYNESEVEFAEPDPKSMMVDPIPAQLTGGKMEIGWNVELSEGDKNFIAQIYPRAVAA